MEGRPRDERELVLRAQGGDPRAFEELVRAHQEIAYRVAYVIARNPSDAEDAAQEGLVKAWRALGRFRAGEPLRPWLLRIVANEAINRRRAERRRAGLVLRVREAAEGHPTVDAAPSPERAALEQEQRREVVSAVNSLRPEDRLVIAYRYWFELSEAEMAEALGCPRGTVKSRLSRALGRLRAGLDAAGVSLPADPEVSIPVREEVVDG